MIKLTLFPWLTALLGVAMSVPFAQAEAGRPVRVLIWDERQPEQAQAYENFLGNAIAAHLEKLPGFVVRSVGLDSPEQGLDSATLAQTDVVIWWGHRRHPDVDAGRVRELVDRVEAGQLSLIALHSAHWSQPFVLLMAARGKEDALQAIPAADRATAKLNVIRPKAFAAPKADSPLTPELTRLEKNEWQLVLPNCCFPVWRNDGAPGHLKTLLGAHPIAQGLPAAWDIPQTEMYSAPFHVPAPDAVIFEEHWDKGEHFPSGSLWKVGKGQVFYFRPGHETYPVFRQAEVLRVLENAARWLGAGAAG